MPRKFANTPADPLLPRVPLELNGKIYNLCFDYEALREAERAFQAEGHRAALVVTMNDPYSFDSVSLVLPCALRRFHPEITWQDAQAMVNLGNVALIAGAIWEAREASLPKKSKDGAEGENPTQP